MFDSTKKAIGYLYFRFLLVTELYMVEPWERLLILFMTIVYFAALSIFNNRILLRLISFLFSPTKLDDFMFADVPLTMLGQM